MTRSAGLFAILLGLLFAAGAAPKTAPCAAPELRQFDFWVGEWDLTWEGGSGTNRVHRVLDACAVEENFSGSDADGQLRGMSLSVYDTAQRQWRQTWVDNQGSYLDFTGGLKDGRMVLGREAIADGKRFAQRMIFYNITPNALDWSWERSDDGGRSWRPLWKIHYARRA
jgi:hypothetical protein